MLTAGFTMRLYSSESFWSIAQLWYLCFGLVISAMLVNAVQHGFDELRDIVSRMRPMGWVVIVAAFAPGPIAHWLSIRLKG
jgi:hypothetical protein